MTSVEHPLHELKKARKNVFCGACLELDLGDCLLLWCILKHR